MQPTSETDTKSVLTRAQCRRTQRHEVLGDSWFSDGFRDTQRFDNERSAEPPDVSPAVSEKRSNERRPEVAHNYAMGVARRSGSGFCSAHTTEPSEMVTSFIRRIAPFSGVYRSFRVLPPRGRCQGAE